ncbi:hypothetical protein Taro_037892, partial [Colocasia esculenta]|nr:hypothetical protein [Colocasia esculenta]
GMIVELGARRRWPFQREGPNGSDLLVEAGWRRTAVTKDRTALLERFLHLRTPMFFGEYDPDKAESWMHKLEHKFETMEFAEEDQSDLTVTQYHQGFVRLLRHVPHVASSEQACAERFIAGLRPDMRWGVTAEMCDTLREVVAKAATLERENWQSQQQQQQGGASSRSSPYQRLVGGVIVELGARRRWPFQREGPNKSALLVQDQKWLIGEIGEVVEMSQRNLHIN